MFFHTKTSNNILYQIFEGKDISYAYKFDLNIETARLDPLREDAIVKVSGVNYKDALRIIDLLQKYFENKIVLHLKYSDQNTTKRKKIILPMNNWADTLSINNSYGGEEISK